MPEPTQIDHTLKRTVNKYTNPEITKLKEMLASLHLDPAIGGFLPHDQFKKMPQWKEVAERHTEASIQAKLNSFWREMKAAAEAAEAPAPARPSEPKLSTTRPKPALPSNGPNEHPSVRLTKLEARVDELEIKVKELDQLGWR